MTFASQIEGIVFAAIPASNEGSYRFQVMEMYVGYPPVTYNVEISDESVQLIKTNGGYSLQIRGNPFVALEDKVAKLGCEAYIYPKFVTNQ